MMRSFSLVDHKVAEAHFFLQQISESETDFFAVRCYVSAFASAARAITWALQAVMKEVEGSASWYAQQQRRLREDVLCRFFHEFRTVSQHVGENPVGRGSLGPGGSVRYWFTPSREMLDVPGEDVAAACTSYFIGLLGLVHDCYLVFGPQVDAHQYYTAEHFAKLGKTIEDAEEEVVGVRGWTQAPGVPAEARWRMIRESVCGCEINHLFEQYLGKRTP